MSAERIALIVLEIHMAVQRQEQIVEDLVVKIVQNVVRN